MATTLVPKRLAPKAPDRDGLARLERAIENSDNRQAITPPDSEEFDREALLEKLFALPVPPPRAGARPYPLHTALGRIMRLKNVTIQDLQRHEGVPNARRMTEYLAGRKPVPPMEKRALADALGVDVRLL